jgi:hypothetical protein
MTDISLIQGESHCETSVMFPQGIPANAGAEVTINGTQLVPSPFINIVVEKYYMGDYVIGGVWKITLNGTIVGDNFNDVATQAASILNLGSTGDCLTLTVKCSDTFIENGYGKIISISVNEGNQPTWVNIAPYTIELEIYENDGAPVVTPTSTLTLADAGTKLGLKSYSEEFNLSVTEDTFSWDEVPGVPAAGSDDENYINMGNQHVKVTFSISATGIGTDCENATDEYGLAAAEIVIAKRINHVQNMNLTDLVVTKVQPSTLMGHLDSYAGGESFLQFRSISVNTMENSLSVSGELIYRPASCKNPEIFTTMTVEENMDNEGRTVTISGNVKGLVNVNTVTSAPDGSYYSIIGLSSDGDLPDCLDRSRMGVVHTFINYLTSEDGIKLLKNIADANEHHPTGLDYISDTCPAEAGFGDDICVSPIPSPSPIFCELRLISSQISRVYGEGQANFSFVLTNKQNCGVIGAKKVEVEITDDNPRDNIVEILIPGRGDKGVLIQNLCCKSATKKGISINATLNTNRCNPQMTNTDYTNMKTCLDNYFNQLEIDEGVNCWFIVENQISRGNNTYRISKQYVKPSCP